VLGVLAPARWPGRKIYLHAPDILRCPNDDDNDSAEDTDADHL